MGNSEKKSFSQRYNEWGYEHLAARQAINYFILFFVSTFSAAVFAFGYCTFINPNVDGVQSFVSGGVSGISQDISLLIEILIPASKDYSEYFFPIFYFGLNIPVFILAIRGIGRRFAIFTLINVIEVSIFTSFFGDLEFIQQMTAYVDSEGGMLARSLFGGVCTGVAAALCFRFDFSDGGVDVIAYYIALVKSETVGRYVVILNSIIIACYTLLSSIQAGALSVEIMGAALFSLIYMFTGSLVIDRINVRNKKVEMKIYTNNKDLHKIILLNIPHGATLIKGIGAYSGQEKTIISMVVSSYEVNKLVQLVQKNDPNAFVQATCLQQVYGRFFIKPVK
ncbi:MAG: YitT family protein [Bacillota bacterium]|nr:YitT family protein [Bacillota bacterium]